MFSSDHGSVLPSPFISFDDRDPETLDVGWYTRVHPGKPTLLFLTKYVSILSGTVGVTTPLLLFLPSLTFPCLHPFFSLPTLSILLSLSRSLCRSVPMISVVTQILFLLQCLILNSKLCT